MSDFRIVFIRTKTPEKKKGKAACDESMEKKNLAPRARFELATLRLTAECSTIELPGSSRHSLGKVDAKSVNDGPGGVNASSGDYTRTASVP
jgi:hypothetical protein